MPRPVLAWCPATPREGAEPASQPTFEHHLLEAYLAGLQWVETPLATLATGAPEVLRLLRHRCDQHGLRISAVRLEAAVGAGDDDAAQLAVGATEAALEVARMLGAPGVTLTVGPEPGDLDEAEVLERVAGALAPVAEAAVRKGLVLALENRWHTARRRWEPMPASTFADLLGSLEAFGVRGHLSTRASLRAGEDPARVLGDLPELPWQVRLGDLTSAEGGGRSLRAALGDGLLDLDGVLGALARRGYEGLLGVEGPQDQGARWQSLHRLRQGVARHWSWV